MRSTASRMHSFACRVNATGGRLHAIARRVNPAWRTVDSIADRSQPQNRHVTPNDGGIPMTLSVSAKPLLDVAARRDGERAASALVEP